MATIETKQIKYLHAARAAVETVNNPRQTDISENLLRVLLQMPTGKICILLCVYRTKIKVMMFHERELFHEQQVKAAPYLISLNVASDGTTGYGFSKQNCVAFSENYRISKKDPEEDPLLGAFYERVFVIAPGHMDKVIAMLEKEL